MDKVMYSELNPEEFRRRIQKAPIAYLPLGTLEWHGEHLPLGADGIQSQGFFEILARKVGGIVLPMLFLGPDRAKTVDGRELYGMDFCTNSSDKAYQDQQLAGSAYRVPDELFMAVLDAVMKQLARAGFSIVVAHGHGPSMMKFINEIPAYLQKYALKCFTCLGSDMDKEGMGIQVDHAAMNETSLVMALQPDLVKMENLPSDLSQWPVGISGKDPRVHASRELGERIISMQAERMIKILQAALGNL